MPTTIPRLRVLRHKLRVTHTDPLSRELSIELTVHNDHSDSADEAVLVEDVYRPGLRVYDSDGSELALLPNTVIREILEGSSKPEDGKLLETLNKHQSYVYWVVFPGSRAIEPHGTRVIRMVWTESRKHSFPWAWGLKAFFNIPAFRVEVNVPPTADWPHFVTVYPPSGYRLVTEEYSAEVLGANDSRPLTEKDHYHIGAWGPLLDISIPHVDNHTVRVRAVYGVYPDRNEADLLGGIMVGLLLLAIGFFVSMLLWVAHPGSFHNHKLIRSALVVLQGNATIIGTTVILLCAGFVGLVSGPVYLRAKWWAIVCGAVAAAAILVATL